MEKYLFIGIGVLLSLLYLKFRFFSKKYDDYDKLYKEIVESDKYRVKGQFD